jgi:hypothetical protein
MVSALVGLVGGILGHRSVLVMVIVERAVEHGLGVAIELSTRARIRSPCSASSARAAHNSKRPASSSARSSGGESYFGYSAPPAHGSEP